MRRPRKRCPGVGLVTEHASWDLREVCQGCRGEVGVRKVPDDDRSFDDGVERWKYVARYHQVSA